MRGIVVGCGNAPSIAQIGVHFNLFPLTDRALCKRWLFLSVSADACVYNVCNMDFAIDWSPLGVIAGFIFITFSKLFKQLT